MNRPLKETVAVVDEVQKVLKEKLEADPYDEVAQVLLEQSHRHMADLLMRGRQMSAGVPSC